MDKKIIFEIFNSAEAKVFIDNILQEIIKNSKETIIRVTREKVAEIVEKQIDKINEPLIRNALYIIKDVIIDFILEKVNKKDYNVVDVEATVIESNLKGGFSLINSAKNIILGLKNKGIPIGAAIDAVNNLYQTITDYYKIREIEKTKRAVIQAEKEIILSQINAQREILTKYLDKTFEEREKNFKKLFEILDIAIEKDNLDMLNIATSGIVDLAKTSPFKDLATTMAALKNKTFVLDI